MRMLRKTTVSILALGTVLLFATVALAQAQDAKKWPQDAMDVTMAVADRLTGGDSFTDIRFAPETLGTMEGLQDGFYHPFNEGVVAPAFYQNHGTGTEYNADLAGYLNLQDQYGRYAGLQFLAKYHVMGKHIIVRECIVTLASPPTIPIEVYLVPATVFEEQCQASGANKDWASFYQFVKSNAYKPGDPEEKQVYYVVSFVMSRLPDDAGFEPIVSQKKNDRFPKDNIVASKQEIFSYQGWRGHVFALKFKPGSLRDRFYINYYYTPGAGIPEGDRDRILVGRYDTNQ